MDDEDARKVTSNVLWLEQNTGKADCGFRDGDYRRITMRSINSIEGPGLILWGRSNG